MTPQPQKKITAAIQHIPWRAGKASGDHSGLPHPLFVFLQPRTNTPFTAGHLPPAPSWDSGVTLPSLAHLLRGLLPTQLTLPCLILKIQCGSWLAHGRSCSPYSPPPPPPSPALGRRSPASPSGHRGRKRHLGRPGRRGAGGASRAPLGSARPRHPGMMSPSGPAGRGLPRQELARFPGKRQRNPNILFILPHPPSA